MTEPAGEARDAARFASQPIVIGGVGLVADASGCLLHPGERALIVADLHFEKGSSLARRGAMLPPYDTRETLTRLAAVIERTRPRTVIALGDSFHDDDGAGRLGADERAMLARLQRRRTWVWIRGNHDAEAPDLPGGEASAEVLLDGIALRHEPSPTATEPEIAGHLHPAARVQLSGATIRRRCFVATGQRLILPAFGAFTGGLNVLSAPFAPLFPAGLSVWLVGERGLYPVHTSALRPD